VSLLLAFRLFYSSS